MDISLSYSTKTAQETAEIGQKIGTALLKEKQVGRAKIIALHGQLGSGKTTFIQGLARGLGMFNRLLSPTFIIVRRYKLENKYHYFYHVDLYRLNDQDAYQNLGLKEWISDPTAIIAIEWAEKLGDFLPKDKTDIHFSVREDGRHHIQMSQYVRNK